jgi:cytoskeletal protein CcmA (bactofilin family)
MSKNNQPVNEAPNISIIGAGTVIVGEIAAKGDIRIDGTIKGKMNVQGKIVLGASGSIEGEVKAGSADISGTVHGIMQITDSLSMKASSRIEGDLKVGKLSIEPGAVFTGNCHMGSNLKTEQQHVVLPNEERAQQQ